MDILLLFFRLKDTIRHKALWAIVGLAMVSAASARAEFVRDYRGWNRLTAAEQRSYVAGVLDQSVVAGAVDDRQLVIRSSAELCLARPGITSKSIADGVSEMYRKEPKLAKQPPFLVAWYTATRLCQAEINAELARAGLEQLDVENILQALKLARSH